LPKQVVALVCIWFVTFVGLVDYATGYETFFFTYYLLAIFAGTWRLGGFFGGLISALSVTAWVSANIAAGARYSSVFVPVWNAAIMFTIYLVVVWLLTSLKKNHAELEERVRQRTEALTRAMDERTHLQKELLETADREQRRIGHALHDGLCQHLTGTAMAAHLLTQKFIGTAQPEPKEAKRLVQLIEHAIELTRDLSHQLDPVELKAGQLTDHLEDLAAEIRNRFKVACEFQHRLTRPVAEATVATHLFRITQDAVANALNPGRATRINIGLDSSTQEIVLTIADNGAARAESPADGDSGLRAMAYRADLIGAAFRVERLPSGGMQVTCTLPAPTGTNYVEKNQNPAGR
ncbi:MAG TPA: histidine kinase, partial [Verrucomicrobiae bacterium]